MKVGLQKTLYKPSLDRRFRDRKKSLAIFAQDFRVKGLMEQFVRVIGLKASLLELPWFTIQVVGFTRML